ncbi:MAG: CoA-binding protein, partial [Vulcanisaeta sp.]
INVAELLEALANNDYVRVVVLYIEGLKHPGDGRRLLEAMRRVTKVKPVVVYKAGRSKASGKAVRSHTAALAGNYEIYRAMLRQAGAIEIDSLMDALEVAKALVTQPLPKGNRVLVVTESGGAGVQAIDNMEAVGLAVPELPQELQNVLARSLPPFASTANPVDLTGSVTDAMYKFVLD